MKTEQVLLLAAAALGGYVLYRRSQVPQPGFVRVNAPAPRVNPASPFAAPGVPNLLQRIVSTVQDARPSLNYMDLPPGSVWNEELDGYVRPFYESSDLADLYL